jgi:hypothetical protein
MESHDQNNFCPREIFQEMIAQHSIPRGIKRYFQLLARKARQKTISSSVVGASLFYPLSFQTQDHVGHEKDEGGKDSGGKNPLRHWHLNRAQIPYVPERA